MGDFDRLEAEIEGSQAPRSGIDTMGCLALLGLAFVTVTIGAGIVGGVAYLLSWMFS